MLAGGKEKTFSSTKNILAPFRGGCYRNNLDDHRHPGINDSGNAYPYQDSFPPAPGNEEAKFYLSCGRP
jgi:hypothetical protein